VSAIDGSGAAGGIAGALAALGGTLLPGFDLVADELDLYDQLEGADLIITGEGHLDAQSFAGKVVGGMTELGREYGIPVAAIVGVADRSMERHIPTWTLVDAFGDERALREPLWCIEQVAGDVLRRFEADAP
jgi:glycerate kinase